MNKVLLGALVVFAAALLSAQEFNDALGPSKQPAHAGTIFDEIANAQERGAFRDVWNAQQPQTQRTLGLQFVEQYPASVLLREAYELIARASVKTGRLDDGLDWAKRSLRLMPENPFLLILVADIAERQHQQPLAEASARDALLYLDRAVTPSPYSPQEWPKVRNQLRASAFFVLGRVLAARAQYEEAIRVLGTGLSLHPDDLEAIYVYGVVLQAAKEEDAAAASFARVVAGGGPLAERAIQPLRLFYSRRSDTSSLSFADYVRSLKWTPPTAPPPAVAPASAGRYAGSVVCGECHARIYDSWRTTGMARMLRPYRSSDVMGDFSGTQSVEDNARPIIDGNRHFIEVRSGAGGSWVRYPVDFIIGSKWQQAYATRLPDQQMLVFPIQYSRLYSRWVNYWKMVDGPDSPRTDITLFHKKPEGARYGETCAPCHTSQLQLRERTALGGDTTFKEPGINCEMCHGPSADHIDRIKDGTRTASANASGTPVRFSALPPAQYVAICSQCHAQSAVHSAQAGGTINFSESGAQFYRTYPAHLPSSFSRKAFYRDGRYRATTFIAEAFSRSACFRQGGATCGSCHDPHPARTAGNPTSLKFEQDSNEMCLQCHQTFKDRVAQHAGHAAGTEASRCVSCHMPKNMEALLFQSRSHQIDEIPDAEMTMRFGKSESPNACLGCHADRDAAWLISAMTERRSTAERARSGSLQGPR